MKFIWTGKDVTPGALIAKRHGENPISPEHFKMIGYLVGESSEKKYVIVSLSDGCVYDNPRTLEELAEEMTRREFEPLTLPQKQSIEFFDQKNMRR